MPSFTYLVQLVVCVTSSATWAVTNISTKSAARTVRTTLRMWIPKRLHNYLGLSCSNVCWLPYLYVTPKGKCFPDGRRVCEKPGHSCARKIVSYCKWPRRRHWRFVGRAVDFCVKNFTTGWECWSLSKAPDYLRSRLERIRRNDLDICLDCGDPICGLQGVVGDAGQFFEEVDPLRAISCLSTILAAVVQTTGQEYITVGVRPRVLAYLGGHPSNARTDTVTFHWNEVLWTYAAAVSIGFVSLGVKVVRFLGIPIGGLVSRSACSAVLNSEETTFVQRWDAGEITPIIAPNNILQVPWDELVVSVRYVDDIVLASFCVCRTCLCKYIKLCYSVTFDINDIDNNQFDWLDVSIDINTAEITYKRKPPTLLPRWSTTFPYYRAYLVGRVHRIHEIKPPNYHLPCIVYDLLSDLISVGVTKKDFRSLFHTTSHLPSTPLVQLLRSALKRCSNC